MKLYKLRVSLISGAVYLAATMVIGTFLPLSEGIVEAVSVQLGPGGMVLITIHSFLIGALAGWIVFELHYQGVRFYIAEVVVLWTAFIILNQMEVLYFRQSLPLFTDRDLIYMTLQELIELIICIAVVLTVTRKHRKARPQTASTPWPKRLHLKIVIALLGYPFVYYGFGFIAWSFPQTREFYSGWAESNGNLFLLGFQIIRSAGWGLCALFIIRGTKKRRLSLFLVPALFVGATALGMIVPNPVMPPMIRLSHGIELTLSMIFWGIALVFMFQPTEKAL